MLGPAFRQHLQHAGLFGDYLPLGAWLGMALIVASAIAAGVLRARAAPLTAKTT